MLIIYSRHFIRERIGIVLYGLSRLLFQHLSTSAPPNNPPEFPIGSPFRRERPLKHQVFNLDSVLIVFYNYLRRTTCLTSHNFLGQVFPI